MLREVRKTRAQMEAVREEARAELELVRKEFGHIQVDDPNRIQISRIEGREAKGGVHYRMRIPPGHRYFLHLADVSGDAYSDLGQPKNLKPTETLSMNSWRDGADLILSWRTEMEDDGKRRIEVFTDSEPLFSYRIENWKETSFPNSGYHLTTDEQKSFAPDETIFFMSWGNDETKRGIALWMEPLTQERLNEITRRR